MDDSDARAALPDGALSGVRVLDCTEGFAGALVAMMFGDNGAAVVRVVPALADDPADRLAGARQWRRSARTLVLHDDSAYAEAGRLVDEADVVLVTAGSLAADELGLEADLLAARRPDAVVCLIDAFGDHPELGGVPLVDGLAMAAAGRMTDYGNTFAAGRPVYVAPPLASYGAAQAAAVGVLAAVRERLHQRPGQLVRASMVRGLTIFDFWGPAGMPSFRPAASPSPSAEAAALGPSPSLGYTPARARDGRWIQWANWAPHLLANMLDVLGLSELRDVSPTTPADAHRLWEAVLTATASRTSAEWIAALTATGAAGGDVMTATVDGMDHPQARHNGNVVTVDDPEVGPTEQLGPVAAMSATPGRIGVHPWRHHGVLPAADAASSHDLSRPPLDGVVVLEAASMIATPIGSCILADLGARVIKIEPLEGEPGRTLPMIKTLQGKESICVDLRTPEGLAVVHRLVERAHVFLHNYRPGVPEKLGIDAATLLGVNPRLVYCYAGAYGKDGPYAKMPAYHPIAGGICGNAVAQAGRGALGPQPAPGDDPDDAPELDLDEHKRLSLHLWRANEGHPDPVTGALVATTIMLGLVARDRTGRGQELTTTMLGASAYLMSANWIRYAGRPPADEVDADLLGTGALDRLYRAADGWVFVGCPTDRTWRALCGVLGHVDLLHDARFANTTIRRDHDHELALLLAESIATRSVDDLVAAARTAGAGVVRADGPGFVGFQQAEVATGRLELAGEVTDATGTHWRAGPPVDMRGVGAVGGMCTAGQHTRGVLAWAGYSAEEVEALVGAGTVRAGA